MEGEAGEVASRKEKNRLGERRRFLLSRRKGKSRTGERGKVAPRRGNFIGAGERGNVPPKQQQGRFKFDEGNNTGVARKCGA